MPNFLGSDLQVYFRFEKQGEWPPVPSEGIRATLESDGNYRLLETPFFVRNVARDDVVAATLDPDGVLWVDSRVAWGGHQTLRISPRPEIPTATTCTAVIAEFGVLQVVGEELEEYQLVALDVPPGIPLKPVKELLLEGRDAGRWWFEEACIAAAW